MSFSNPWKTNHNGSNTRVRIAVWRDKVAWSGIEAFGLLVIKPNSGSSFTASRMFQPAYRKDQQRRKDPKGENGFDLLLQGSCVR